jgi:hypothetical protein
MLSVRPVGVQQIGPKRAELVKRNPASEQSQSAGPQPTWPSMCHQRVVIVSDPNAACPSPSVSLQPVEVPWLATVALRTMICVVPDAATLKVRDA